jgi:hypothetical protein
MLPSPDKKIETLQKEGFFVYELNNFCRRLMALTTQTLLVVNYICKGKLSFISIVKQGEVSDKKNIVRLKST